MHKTGTTTKLLSTVTVLIAVSMLSGCAIVPLAHYFFPSVDLLITGLVGGSFGFAAARFWRGQDDD